MTALLAVLGALGSSALTGCSDSSDSPAVVGENGALPEVPVLGVDLPGWELVWSTDSDLLFGQDPEEVRPQTYAIFRDASARFGSPAVFVTIGPRRDELAGGHRTPIDLDGDGQAEGRNDGVLIEADAAPPTVGFERGADSLAAMGYGLATADLIAYVAELASIPDLRIEDVPPPEGYVLGSVTALPALDARVTHASYRIAAAGSVDITVANQPGWSAMGSYGSSTQPTSYDEVDLGDSILGDGIAALTTTRHPGPSGVIITDTGLFVEITTDSLRYDPDIIRRLLADAPFVEIEATESGPTPTMFD